MKKLPPIYQGNNQNIKTNNSKQCIVGIENQNNEENNQIMIEDIFSGLGYSFNIMLNIKTKDSEKHTSLIGRTKDSIITLDNDIIPISEIVSITRKKN